MKRDKSELKPKVEHSSSGRYVIRTEPMKDPEVKIHVSRRYSPSCDNNHNHDNIIDKEKQNRALNSIQRKKNKDKILEKSRIQLEQTQKEIQLANEVKNNSKKIILPKKLVNDIVRVNLEIQQFQKDQVSQRYKDQIEKENAKVRKYQHQVTQSAINYTHKSMSLINSLNLTNDPKEITMQSELIKLRVRDIQNSLSEKQKRLQDLISHREQVKEKIENVIQAYFKDEESMHLISINTLVLKFFRVIFGRDYAMRQRMDKILANNDAELLKKQIEKTKELKKMPVQRKDIFIPYNQSERFKKEKVDNGDEANFEMQAYSSSQSAGLAQYLDQRAQSISSQVPTYQAKQLEALEQYFQKVFYLQYAINPKLLYLIKIFRQLLIKYFEIIINTEYLTPQKFFSFLFLNYIINCNEKLHYIELIFKQDFKYSQEQLNTLALKQDVLQHLYDFYFNPISENIEYDFKSETWNSLFDQFRLNNLCSTEQTKSIQENISLPQIGSSKKNETPRPYFDVLKSNQAELKSTKNIKTEENKNRLSITSDIYIQSPQQVSIIDPKVLFGSSNEQTDPIYSKEFYQYIREYSIISKSQNKVSKESVYLKVEKNLEQCRQKRDLFDGELDLLEKYQKSPKRSPANSPKFRSQAQSPAISPSNNLILNKNNLQFSTEKVKTPPQSIHNSSKEIGTPIKFEQTSILGTQTKAESPLSSMKLIQAKEQTSQKLPPLNLSQQSSKKVNFDKPEDDDKDAVIEKRLSTQSENQNDDIQQYKKLLDNKANLSKSHSQGTNFKKCGQEALNKCMKELAEQVVSEQTGKYFESVNKLYRQCRLESFKTRKIKNESIRKKNSIQKNFRKIDKEYQQLASL